ncbi:hypothetical protein Sta7437_1743 [Stanieria cyanosphaera PCC 7437]|uniref:Uncharacterized protein n=1 Tax=Stanieria cyanosphaera (strain ATCC 29371 / PCC 7437) TaxID=111780 RepID=K9XUF4_STAC7|nr:hypothetical protein [Stanieria cyanosphaera]AFZ35302.1 hypothetical protein Sta7437_1743 [Stanieria cyanosphaera PCC 7437]
MHFLGLVKFNLKFSNTQNDSLIVSEKKVQKIDLSQEPQEASLARLEEALYADENEGICNLGLYC